MSTGLFISLLNPAIALTLAAAFLLLWLNTRERGYLLLVVIAYAGSATGFLLQHFTLSIGFPATRMLSVGAFMASALCLTVAILARYNRPIPWPAFVVFAVGGFGAFAWFMFVQPDLTWRILSVNFAFGGISLVVAAEIRAVPNRGPIERLLIVLAALSGVNFIVRTVMVVALHGPYAGYEGFYSSLYWTTALLSHAVLSLLIALSLLTAEALDMLRTLRSESLTDPLSSLLNRRGFEAKASAMLDTCRASGLPAALVVADLDRFKALNDSHGHAAGDRVIAEFAARLRSAAGLRAVAGRLGGEEFAVLIPMADPAAARLFAEAVRTVFSAGSIDGLPGHVRVTASFGIAVHSIDETLDDLTRRADEALYHAKRDGRDSIRVSYQRTPEPPPPLEIVQRSA
ncbi:GGDEF domain-containing protein [Mesorhizobium sp. ZMM04-5]|uniref:diguanylate cyclase n=1 Tax=Mesorhizobium marinum TaxID=3228790 RepID=A0ABV3QY06_9HYPH